MDYSSSARKIEEIKPVEKNNIISYVQKIKERGSKEKQSIYYVPYSTEYADKVKVNCYVKNKVNELTIEYDIPSNESQETTRKVKLIIAENSGKIGNFSEIENIVNNFLKNSTIFSTMNALNPEIYIAQLEKMGWSFTQDGMDFMLVTKSQGITEIQKTKFTGAELDVLTKEDFARNEKEHSERIEERMIERLEKYIVTSYEKIPTDDRPEVQPYKEKVLKYKLNKQSGVENSTDLLDAIFREMKPIREKSSLIPLMQRSYIQNLEAYIDMIPDEYRDDELHDCLKEYINIRASVIRRKGK